MNLDNLYNLREELLIVANSPDIINQRRGIVNRIKNKMDLLISEIHNEHPIIYEKLSLIKDKIFKFEQIDFLTLGRALGLLDVLFEMYERKTENIWFYIDSQIASVSKKLYLDGHYDKAVLTAFIEIEGVVKEFYKAMKSDADDKLSGTDLMNKVFSENNPILKAGDLQTATGKNKHNGLRYMLTGAFSALRNPPAHSNDENLTAEEAMRQLMFASMLMKKIYDSIKNGHD